MSAPIILIPARMGSARLPHKPLALIHKEPMIVHVWRKAVQANIAPVYVACDHPDIADAVQSAGGQAVLTHDRHPTGSDRLAQAIDIIDPDHNHDIVINVQGDLPLFPQAVLQDLLQPFQDPNVHMTTLIQPVALGGPLSVKVRVQDVPGQTWVQCVDFSRKGQNATYIHQGVYAFRRTALQTFASLAQTEHERSESLEQLRALDHGMTIAGVVVPEGAFISVDTPQDLEYACAQWNAA